MVTPDTLEPVGVVETEVLLTLDFFIRGVEVAEFEVIDGASPVLIPE